MKRVPCGAPASKVLCRPDKHVMNPLLMIYINGLYRDRLWTRAQRSPTAQLHSVRDLGWRSNIVVTQARRALAAFMKGEDDVLGIRAIQVGGGDAAWDEEGATPPQASMTALVSPIDERAIAPEQIRYLDSTGEPSEEPTTRIQVTVTYGPGEPAPDVALREFGLFGERAGGAYMINAVRHPVIHKGPDDTLERVIRLSF